MNVGSEICQPKALQTTSRGKRVESKTSGSYAPFEICCQRLGSSAIVTNFESRDGLVVNSGIARKHFLQL